MNFHEIFDQIIKKRGIKDPAGFFNPNYNALYDPMFLPDIKFALKRLHTAQKEKQTVAIYGDYDIDGLSAVAILDEALQKFGLKTITYIPDRFVEGYGLSKNGLARLKDDGADLVITVDSGSQSEMEIAYAKKIGLDVIVTDHHDIKLVPKSAIAIINAKRQDSKYPFKERSGAGIAFALVKAMQKNSFKGIKDGQEKWLLDLVALSTISDAVDLLDENRSLVYFGLKVLAKTRRPGLIALMEVADVIPEFVDEESISFRIGPRLNAAGRLQHAKLSLDALTTNDKERAVKIADKLNSLNLKRQIEQAKIYKSALMQAKNSNDAVLVLSDKNWSHGINGIVAAKLVEKFAKPTFIMQELKDGTTKGSARSLGSFDLADALNSVKDILVSGGGHKFAAGVTIKSTDISKFKNALNKYYKNKGHGDIQSLLKPSADVQLDSLDGLTIQLSDLLSQMKPFGQGNPEPIFNLSNIKLTAVRKVGVDKIHAQTVVEDKKGKQLRAIAFGKASEIESIGDKTINIFGTLGRNDYNSQKRVQFVITYIDLL